VPRTGRAVPNGLVGDWRLGSEVFLAAFALPGGAEKHDVLAALHPLPRDARKRRADKAQANQRKAIKNRRRKRWSQTIRHAMYSHS
jgi:hypothetical protein